MTPPSARAAMLAMAGALLATAACGGGSPEPPAPAAAPRETVFAAGAVETPPSLATALTPAYPDSLRRAGVEGDVVVEAVIDRAGRPEPASIRVVSSPHPDFEAPARAVIAQAVFTPGRVQGSAVPTLVRVPVRFRLPSTARQVFRESEVDSPARLLGAPAPVSTGVRGEVVLELVVDTTGRPEMGSVKVVSSTNAALDAPARQSAAKMVFTPARVGARAVRQMVRVPVRFGAGGP